jgi:hypothetical protein
VKKGKVQVALPKALLGSCGKHYGISGFLELRKISCGMLATKSYQPTTISAEERY